MSRECQLLRIILELVFFETHFEIAAIRDSFVDDSKVRTRDTPSSIIPVQAVGLSKGHSVPNSGL